ncbi:hypothetical protein ACH5RR_013228 [Cinchona calisaya]|uniref:Uncharacterized protein n=1 Tax=Cinchona calisaya TaxID=153742 RepID=A0ABD2ZZG9_9GENT
MILVVRDHLERFLAGIYESFSNGSAPDLAEMLHVERLSLELNRVYVAFGWRRGLGVVDLRKEDLVEERSITRSGSEFGVQRGAGGDLKQRCWIGNWEKGCSTGGGKGGRKEKGWGEVAWSGGSGGLGPDVRGEEGNKG